MNRAVIMDRDGTIFRDSPYLADPKGIEIYKGVFPALKQLQKKGWKLIIGTNQSGVGRGYFSVDIMHKIHDRFLAICKKNGVRIDEIFFCPHHPEDCCACRKPEIGMLEAAAKKHRLNLKECVIVGDKKSDIDWGKKGGARTILVLTGEGRKALRRGADPDHVARSMTYAAQWILRRDPTTSLRALARSPSDNFVKRNKEVVG